MKWKGTPWSTLPTATPKISAGTAPPTKRARSQPSRQAGLSSFERYLNATGRRISATSTRNIAR